MIQLIYLKKTMRNGVKWSLTKVGLHFFEKYNDSVDIINTQA